MIESEFISLAVKTLVAVLVITIVLSAVVFYYREQHQKEWQDFGISEKSGFADFPGNQEPKYVMWIGDTVTTLDILALAQQPGSVIQPIYIPDPEPGASAAKSEYELQITSTLRTMINTKYSQSQILPIISITRQRPDDDAFNRKYDMGADDGASDALTRENILHRWAKYYKLTITQPSTATRYSNNKSNNKSGNMRKSTNKKNDSQILSQTWNCRFPIGANQIPCGLCSNCEKMNSLV